MKTYIKPVIEQTEVQTFGVLAMSKSEKQATGNALSNGRRNTWSSGWDD